MSDTIFLQRTIENARKSLALGGYPASSLIIDSNGVIVVEKVNEAITNNDPTAHGEIECIREVCQKLTTLDLTGFTLYATLEPCLMCISACYWARIRRVVFAVRKEVLDRNNYEGNFSYDGIIDKFNNTIELVHVQEHEEEAVDLLRQWETKFRKDWQYSNQKDNSK